MICEKNEGLLQIAQHFTILDFWSLFRNIFALPSRGNYTIKTLKVRGRSLKINLENSFSQNLDQLKFLALA